MEHKKATEPAELEYGMVEVIKGKHKGKVGYYDNDEDDDKAVVYFDTPFVEDYALINKNNIRNTDIKSIACEKFIKNHPDIAREAGMQTPTSKE